MILPYSFFILTLTLLGLLFYKIYSVNFSLQLELSELKTSLHKHLAEYKSFQAFSLEGFEVLSKDTPYKMKKPTVTDDNVDNLPSELKTKINDLNDKEKHVSFPNLELENPSVTDETTTTTSLGDVETNRNDSNSDESKDEDSKDEDSKDEDSKDEDSKEKSKEKSKEESKEKSKDGGDNSVGVPSLNSNSDISKLTLKDLKIIAKHNKVSTKGTKKDIIDRITLLN